MHKGELRRQTILENAGRLFLEKGYIQTSIENILEAIGCSKGSFYHHFTSKASVLDACCHESVKANFAQYQLLRPDGLFDALNCLLYCSHPLRSGGEAILRLLLALRLSEESSIIMSRMRLSLRELFYPELDKLLTSLNASGQIHFTQSKLPEVLWDTHVSFFDTVTACALSYVKNRPALAGQLRDIINAERFLWERLLDAPFGSIEIVKLDEMLSTVNHVCENISV